MLKWKGFDRIILAQKEASSALVMLAHRTKHFLNEKLLLVMVDRNFEQIWNKSEPSNVSHCVGSITGVRPVLKGIGLTSKSVAGIE